MNDDGASHPQARVRVWRRQDQPLRRALRDPAQGDLLTGLPASVPQLGAGQQPSGPPGGVETRQDISAEEQTAKIPNQQIYLFIYYQSTAGGIGL